MTPTFLYFDSDNSDARISVIGAPYDLNSSRRYGSADAPAYIRKSSLEMESNFRGMELSGLPIEDMGDAKRGNWNYFRKSLMSMVKTAVNKGSVPLVFGGDHSVTPVVLKALNRRDISVVAIDAHLDFDRMLNGNRYSHGTPRRLEAGIVGPENIHIIGIRSWPSRAMEDAVKSGVNITTAFDMEEKGIPTLPSGPVYLTIDIDGIDPTYAPGTGTPEPFGMTPWDAAHIIDSIAPRAVGMDIVEVCPKVDINELTSTLASRLAAQFIYSFFSSEQ